MASMYIRLFSCNLLSSFLFSHILAVPEEVSSCSDNGCTLHSSKSLTVDDLDSEHTRKGVRCKSLDKAARATKKALQATMTGTSAINQACWTEVRLVCLAVVRLVHLSQRGLAFVCMPVLPTTSRAAIPFSLAGDDEDLAKMMMVTCLTRTRSNQFHPFCHVHDKHTQNQCQTNHCYDPTNRKSKYKTLKGKRKKVYDVLLTVTAIHLT